LRDFIAAVINNRNVFVKENVNVIKIFVDEFIYDLKIRDRMVKAIPYDYVKNFNDILNDFKQRNLIVDWTNSEIFRFIFSAFFGYVAEHFLIFPDLKFDEKSEIDHTIDSIVKGLQQE
jgi:hypothetical protein